MINEYLISYFLAHVYNGIDDLAETIMNPANCRYSIGNLYTKDSFNTAQPEPVYNGVSYVRLLTTLPCPSNTGFHKFDYPF